MEKSVAILSATMNIITLSNTAIAKSEGAKEEFYKCKSKTKEYDLFLLEKI